MSIPPTRSGHIALAGLPNVGKSSLLNRLVDTHLSPISAKAQTTRLPIVALRTEETTQYVFHDLPGLLEPSYLLHSRMREAGLAALAQAHVILHLHPATEPAIPFWPLTGLEKPLEVPVMMVRTKADLPGARRAEPADGLLVSATTGQGISELLQAIRPLLPERPFEFDPDDVGTQPVRFFATEYLREAAFELLSDEVPYAVAAEVEEYREDATPVYIRVSLYVERESQKGIVIGEGGRTLKAIGSHARARLEELLGSRVYLDCRVKVLPNWRRDGSALVRLGFVTRERP
jgi:GTPase